MKKSTALVLVLLLCVTGIGAAAAPFYNEADTLFTFKAGAALPAYLAFPFDETSPVLTQGEAIRLKSGLHGSVEYSALLTRRLAVGGLLGYEINTSLEGKYLTSVPMLVALSYIPVQTGKFDLLLNAYAGVSFTKYDGDFYLAPALDVSICPKYFFGNHWGVGLDVGLYNIAETYFREKQSDSALYGTLRITLAAAYRK